MSNPIFISSAVGIIGLIIIYWDKISAKLNEAGPASSTGSAGGSESASGANKSSSKYHYIEKRGGGFGSVKASYGDGYIFLKY